MFAQRSSLLAFILICSSNLVNGQEIQWISHLGTSEIEVVYGVAVDEQGNIYLTGSTGGALNGINAGGFDAYLAKFNSEGSLQWTSQFGGIFDDRANGLAVDTIGNIFVSGYLKDANGDQKVYLRKYAPNGDLLWNQPQSDVMDGDGADIAIDVAGDIYVTGFGGVNVRKFDSGGTLLWVNREPEFSSCYSISIDPNGDVFVGGTVPASSGFHALIGKIDSDGETQWTRQLGTTENTERCTAVEADELGNVYLTGDTRGDLAATSAGSWDAFTAKYDSDGTQLWINQYGSSSNDIALSLALDGNDNIYVTGYTGGDLNGQPNTGFYSDAFVIKLDSNGTQCWTRLWGAGPLDHDSARAICIDGLGNIYVGGNTDGDLGRPNFGRSDAYLAKIVDSGPTLINVNSITVNRGQIGFGGISELANSDNEDFSVTRDSSGIQPIIELTVKATTDNETPAALSFNIESSVFARATITQTIELFNYDTAEFELVDSRAASRFSDQVTVVATTGDVSRYVQPETGCLEARLRFSAANKRSRFAANIDQIIWQVECGD